MATSSHKARRLFSQQANQQQDDDVPQKWKTPLSSIWNYSPSTTSAQGSQEQGKILDRWRQQGLLPDDEPKSRVRIFKDAFKAAFTYSKTESSEESVGEDLLDDAYGDEFKDAEEMKADEMKADEVKADGMKADGMKADEVKADDDADDLSDEELNRDAHEVGSRRINPSQDRLRQST